MPSIGFNDEGAFDDDYYYLLTHVIIDDSKWFLAPRATINVKIARNCLLRQRRGIFLIMKKERPMINEL